MIHLKATLEKRMWQSSSGMATHLCTESQAGVGMAGSLWSAHAPSASALVVTTLAVPFI